MQVYRWKGNTNKSMDRQTDRGRGRQKYKQTEEQTERHTRMLPLSQYSYTTHRLGTNRLTDRRAMQTERWTNKTKEQTETHTWMLPLSQYTDWVRTDLQMEGQCKQSDGQTDRQRKKQTERHTWMLPFSQYSHRTHRLGGSMHTP